MVAWLLVLGGGSAWATTGHSFVDQFGGLGTGNGQFSDRAGIGDLGAGPAGVGVSASGDVFTVDGGVSNEATIPRVQRFSAAGVFQSGFAIESPYSLPGSIAVDPAGAVYVSVNREPSPLAAVVKYSAAGVIDYELDAATASASGATINNPLFSAAGTAPLAVDPINGMVYVTATDNVTQGQVVARFSGSTGAFVDYFDGNGSPDGVPFCGPLTSIAVDSAHRVYVLDSCKNRVDQFSGSGTFETTVNLPSRLDGTVETPFAVATDLASDEVYVAHSGPVGLQITHLSAGGGDVVYTFAASEVGSARAMAVSGAGTVYTSDASKPFVQRFTRFDGPTVVTSPASSVEARSAVLEGTIDPEGSTSSYYFEYGTSPTYGERTPVENAGSGSASVAVSAPVDGLEPNKIYYYRLVGSNSAGLIAGVSGSFTTLPAPPAVGESAFASAITPRSARIHGTINTFNSPAHWHLEYGTTTAYGAVAPAFDRLLTPAGSYQPVSVDLAGLEPGTVYHFRVVAYDGYFGGTPVFGADQTFVTSPAAGGGASGVTATHASLTGTINPRGVATSYHFDYGLTASYGASTAEVDGGSGDGDRVVSQRVSGLLPDTTYHVRVVATSADGVVRSGSDGVFRTASAPTAGVIGPTGVSTDAALLGGDVNTFGLTGSYHFDVWSLDSAYKHSTAERPVAGDASFERVTAALAGLPAGETFVVQLIVSSNDAVTGSDLLTFATAAVPRVFPSPPASDGASLYGCGSPRLDAYGAHPKPGETITISGRDLGVGGSVVLGDASRTPVDWSATGFKVTVPKDAAGTLGLTVNCGRRSNTIAIALFQEPDNTFAVTGRSVAGTTATLKVRVPGPGKLESFGAGSRAAKVTIKKPGSATIKVRLTSAGASALRKAASRTSKVAVRVRFTPAGGRSASKTVTITFKRKGAR